MCPRLFLQRVCIALVCTISALAGSAPALADRMAPSNATDASPSVLILYDGPDQESNPGLLDARFLANLLGHFTTRRTIRPLEAYHAGDWKAYDAVLAIVYKIHYRVPAAFLQDAPQINRPFCWMGNQPDQLDRAGLLRKRGIAFQRFFQNAPLTRVLYKGRVLDKGDSETNILRVIDPHRAHVLATATGPTHLQAPYVIQSGSFWIVADSPFSYWSESDRYYVLADLLHDILGIQHPEDHRALIRIEDINPTTELEDAKAMLSVFRKHRIPFSFGYTPVYVNPTERLWVSLSDKPALIQVLQKLVAAGGAPVLHGYTHQYRGVSEDDYEFWDSIADRPVRGDSEKFMEHRITEALRESVLVGLYPITWETPHYAASALDYRVIRRHFRTVYERRQMGSQLETDQLFPYPVVDIYGQWTIPESLAYVPLENPTVEPLLKNADAAWVVRDGYASAFFHPFLKPELLDRLISGLKERGYRFVDLKSFPNEVRVEGTLITTVRGPAEISGRGRFLNVQVRGKDGALIRQKTLDVPETGLLRHPVDIQTGETYVALRQDVRPPGFVQKLLRTAKGDLSVLHRKWEEVFSARAFQDPLKTILVWNPKALGDEARDQASFASMLDAFGFDLERVDLDRFTQEELGTFGLLVIPVASARSLPAPQVDRVVRAVKQGIVLVTDGDSPLAQALGIRLGDSEPVRTLVSHLNDLQDIRWPDPPVVPWVAKPSLEALTPYYSDRETQHPLAVGGAYGEGRFLYFAPLFDPVSSRGYARFPDVPYILLHEYGLAPSLRGQVADVYFDPGYRQSVSIERLARLWRRRGIRAIHVAAWHFYNRYTYDYARLIKVAHQNGILVYAWFEWPHISEAFWKRHPEWREKTALLTDAHVDWRYPMNLLDPKCLKAVLEDTEAFLKGYDWDGVNIAELTFESKGPEHPQFFTPFNTPARRGFQNLHGFDPVELFQANSPHYWKTAPDDLRTLYRYRRHLNTHLLETFLKALAEIDKRQERRWEVVVTVLDALQHPELSDSLAIDLERTVELINRYGATLQVEDPASEWSKPPERYAVLGERYRQLPLKKPFMIDINVLPSHPSGQEGFATAQPTGTELLHLWRAAAAQAPRVCLYSESSIYDPDWEVLPYAMAAHAKLYKEGEDWMVETPHTVILELGRGIRKCLLDGEPWMCTDKGDVLIPPGAHRLSFHHARPTWIDTAQLRTRLISVTGELLGSQLKRRGLELEYLSSSRAVLMLNKLPYKTLLDGKTAKLTTLRGDDGFVLIAPPGQHRLQVLGESLPLYVIEFTSLVSASLIVLFGMVSSGLLALLFLFVTLHRRTHRIRRFVLERLIQQHG